MSLAGWLALVVLVETVAVMVLWTRLGRTWYKSPAGRSVMGLLACLALLFALSVSSALFGRYEARELVYLIAYALLVMAIAGIGVAIVLARRSGRRNK